MSGEKLLPCWHCGDDAEVSYGVGDYDYDGGDRWRFYRARVTCRCGSELRVENDDDGYLPLERALDFAVEAWNTRAAVTDYEFAMAVHDGNLWGKCSKCKERKGYYLDAETIRNQQERIAELEAQHCPYVRWRDGESYCDCIAYVEKLKAPVRDMFALIREEYPPHRYRDIGERMQALGIVGRWDE